MVNPVTSTEAFALVVHGERMPTESRFDVIDPATGEPFAQAPDCSRAHLDVAMASAESAFQAWARDEDARRAALAAARDVVDGATEELAHLLTAEQGKPLGDARLEVQGTAETIDYYGRLDVPTEVIRDDERARVEVLHRPLGVVAAITPWNFPLHLASMKLAPALRAGNTVVLKPSPFTPLATLRLGELLAEVLPPGVLNVVTGGDGLGAWMTSHPTPRKISFTGSTATGRLVAAAAASDLKRLTLELGGNDAAIVLDDVDPAAVANRLFWGAFANNGQVCGAIKRLYVPRALHDELVEALAERARSVKVGDGREEGVRLGPVNNRPQLERVATLVEGARQAGAGFAAGGGPIDGPGYFFAPTIVVGVADGVRVVDEEQFGPVLPVVAYDDEDDAVARANAGRFGLSGSVWSADEDRGAAVAARLQCGTAWVNTHLAYAPSQPIAGWKWSGVGVENGLPGLFGFTETQVLHRSKSRPRGTA